jgi:hypothetical protein
MIDAPDFIERRHDKRYAITNGIVALPRSTTVAIGTIVNISKGGIAVRYTSSAEQNGSSNQIDILLTDHNFFITEIPVNTIADFQIEDRVPFSYIYERRSCMQFHDLTANHRHQLDELLSKYIAVTG